MKSFKNRISLYNLLGVAILTLIVFISIYWTVSLSVNYDINENLNREINVHQGEISAHDGVISLVPEGEWAEPEHQSAFMNPVFVEIYNADKKPVEKSPNLKDRELSLTQHEGKGDFIDTHIDSIPIRQVQTPLLYNGETVGYAVIAMSIESEIRVLDNLKFNLLLTYPVFLLVLFFVTRFIAQRSIQPALGIIESTKNITDNNFDQRISLPIQNDELYVLSVTINELLDRVENAITREKQFTSDASHELRTPLAIIKGTLEVLIRKPRKTEEYIEKIKYCIEEVNRINNLVDQLLMLARFESYDKTVTFKNVALDQIIQEILERYAERIQDKQLKVVFTVKKHFYVISDALMLSIIIENLLSNAIKYSKPAGLITIDLSLSDTQSTICTITDEGIGISPKELDKVYNQFYRAEATEHSEIKGSGLGLAIVKKITQLLHLKLDIESSKDIGTKVTLKIKNQQ